MVWETRRVESAADSRTLLSIPPYVDFIDCTDVPKAFEEGAVFLIPLPTTVESSYEAIQRADGLVRTMRRSHPALLIGGWSHGGSHTDLQATVRLLATSGLRLWIQNRPTEALVRHAAGAGGLLASDLEVWLTHRLHPRGLMETGMVRMIASLGGGGRLPTVDAMELKRCLRRLGLPTIRSWRSVARALDGLVQLQTHQTLAVAEAARSCGYADGPSFAHATKRLFNVAPSVARDRIGWEWLLSRFLRA